MIFCYFRFDAAIEPPMMQPFSHATFDIRHLLIRHFAIFFTSSLCFSFSMRAASRFSITPITLSCHYFADCHFAAIRYHDAICRRLRLRCHADYR